MRIDLEKRHKEVEAKKAELAKTDTAIESHEPEPRQQPAAPAKEEPAKKAEVEIPTIQDKLYNGDGTNANRSEQPEELKQRLKEKMHKMEEQLSGADATHVKDQTQLTAALKQVTDLQSQLLAAKNATTAAEQHEKKTAHDLADITKKYDELKNVHEAEVNDLFESKSTLAFVQQMKTFKKEWAEKAGDDDRRSVATQMASATKQWVGQEDSEQK